ncbi:MAG: C40 family peptidase [Tannerella sp.]|jgi:cell wall-associated NlpC family hydrolase|nr:C40 family peptidase [Tannerella sp.]
MRRLNTFVAISFLMTGICFSCVTRRHTAVVSERAGRLASKLNMRVTPEDNLKLYDMLAKWIGTPYRAGQSSRKGTDCSGFVSVIYKQIYGKELARSSAAMWQLNCRTVKNPAKLREGDLVFFRTNRNSKLPSHVGIYLKDRKFVHASTSRGVTISSLDEPYYRNHWISGGVVK